MSKKPVEFLPKKHGPGSEEEVGVMMIYSNAKEISCLIRTTTSLAEDNIGRFIAGHVGCLYAMVIKAVNEGDRQGNYCRIFEREEAQIDQLPFMLSFSRNKPLMSQAQILPGLLREQASLLFLEGLRGHYRRLEKSYRQKNPKKKHKAAKTKQIERAWEVYEKACADFMKRLTWRALTWEEVGQIVASKR